MAILTHQNINTMSETNDWSGFYRDRINSDYQKYFNSRYEPMLRAIRGLAPDGQVYELGCGIGSISKALGSVLGGIDVDPEMVALANENLGVNIFEQGSIYDFITYGDVPNLTVTHGVLEHYDDETISFFTRNLPNSIHYVPLDRYVTPSFGDERLLPYEYWLDLVKPTLYQTFNEGHDLWFYIDSKCGV